MKRNVVRPVRIGLMLIVGLLGCKPSTTEPRVKEPAAAAEQQSVSGAEKIGDSSKTSRPSNPSSTTPAPSPAESLSPIQPPPPTVLANNPQPAAENLPTFTMLGVESGLDFRRNDDIRGEHRIFESTGGGVAMLDFDNDDWLDLLFTGGCRMPRSATETEPTCGLYRNESGSRFQSKTFPARMLQSGYCQGVTVGDWDNDGFEDVFIAAFGKCGLWHNRGDGTFEDVSVMAGVQLDTWASSCAFADLNLDGNLDLYVVTYLKESADNPLRCPNSRAPDGLEQCPPSKFEGLSDVLYLSDGRGLMLDASEASAINRHAGKGLGIVVSDLDRDGRPDLYIGNDGEPNHLYKNEGNLDQGLSLRECAALSGAALTESGFAQASMGIAAGDYDNNGTIDLVVTNYSGDSDTFYKNNGGFQFEDVTRRTGLAGPSRPVLGWGTVLADFNSDGQLDLAVVNGHVDDRRWLGQGERYRMPAQIYVHSGNNRYTDVSKTAGDFFQTEWMARGLACGDVNRDGKLDLAINHQLDVSTCLLNSTPGVPPMRRLKLVGTQSNRSAINAKVEYFSNDGKQLAYRELCGGTSFQSSHAQEIYIRSFAGDNEIVRITWPSGHMWEGVISTLGETLVEDGGARLPKP